MSQSDAADPTGAPLWREMSPKELEREYSPSSAIGGNYQPFVEQYQALSETARSACERRETLVYGDLPANTIDVALPEPSLPGPLIVFIHGGYWQEGSKHDSFHGADAFVDQGIAYATVGYTLAPDATLSEIVSECRAAVRHLVANADGLQVDPNQMYLAGSSAGAQLAAMCCVDGALGSDTQIAGVILLSGIFDLEPLVHTSINEAVALTVDEARANSPLLLNVSAFPDAIITWGAQETLEFKRQSRALVRKLDNPSRNVSVFESPSRNHFDVVHDLADASTKLGHATLQLIKER